MSSLPASYHVVGRSNGESRFETFSAPLYEGPDLSEAHGVYREAVEIAKAAPAATVTLYKIVDGKRYVEPGCRFDGAAWRAQRLPGALSGLAAGLQAAGAAVALGGAS